MRGHGRGVVIEDLADDFLRHVPVETGRERITSHAEWVSLTAGRWRYLSSSLRFFVASVASCCTLAQREWTQHSGIWRNRVLLRPL